MTMTKNTKKEIMDKFAAKPGDTGSAAVQVALLTERIQYISKHLTGNPKDYSTKRGLTLLISKRKRLLSYLEKNSKQEYSKLIQQLGLRK